MKLYKEIGIARPAWLLLNDTDPVPNGFIESIDIVEWDQLTGRVDYDYYTMRHSIKKLVTDSGIGNADVAFNGYDTIRKNICMKYKIASDSVREAYAGYDLMVEYGTEYNRQMIEARRLRADKVTSEISNRLPNQRFGIMAQTATIFNNYKEFGVEGIASGDPISGVIDYINGTNAYNGNGLRQSGYVPGGMTLDQLCDKLLEILVGNGVG